MVEGFYWWPRCQLPANHFENSHTCGLLVDIWLADMHNTNIVGLRKIKRGIAGSSRSHWVVRSAFYKFEVLKNTYTYILEW